MNPGLVVKLRPAGPWRIGPDSGARNRVDTVYHSDSLYSAVTAAMARLGQLEAWLDATARRTASAVCFSSCFPFLDEIGFVIPPRTLWPPAPASLTSGRVRWRSARFVPLGIVQSILAGQQLDENQWVVDGPSECLVPTGRLGPFRAGVRSSAAVDRLTGAAERHSTACLEFRPGAGFWTVVSFRDEDSRARWSDLVKAAFRWLADSGFGGERSRGWGRAEAPEFVEGTLPEMILPPIKKAEAPVRATPPAAPKPVEPAQAEPTEKIEAEVRATPPAAPLAASPESSEHEEMPAAPLEAAAEPAAEPEPAGAEAPALLATAEPEAEVAPEAQTAPAAEGPKPDVDVPPMQEPPPAAPEPPVKEPPAEPAPEPNPPEPPANPEPGPPEPAPLPAAPAGLTAQWLLSLFSPAASDGVDWQRGNYSLLARGGRIESPAGSGELKKTVQMVAEGSVIFTPGAPQGAAPDVAPEGFAHPVFRAGFALSIPLPEGR